LTICFDLGNYKGDVPQEYEPYGGAKTQFEIACINSIAEWICDKLASFDDQISPCKPSESSKCKCCFEKQVECDIKVTILASELSDDATALNGPCCTDSTEFQSSAGWGSGIWIDDMSMCENIKLNRDGSYSEENNTDGTSLLLKDKCDDAPPSESSSRNCRCYTYEEWRICESESVLMDELAGYEISQMFQEIMENKLGAYCRCCWANYAFENRMLLSLQDLFENLARFYAYKSCKFCQDYWENTLLTQGINYPQWIYSTSASAIDLENLFFGEEGGQNLTLEDEATGLWLFLAFYVNENKINPIELIIQILNKLSNRVTNCCELSQRDIINTFYDVIGDGTSTQSSRNRTLSVFERFIKDINTNGLIWSGDYNRSSNSTGNINCAKRRFNERSGLYDEYICQ
jgi:hypothetical protein